jgi:hypothetical protein
MAGRGLREAAPSFRELTPEIWRHDPTIGAWK